MLLCTGLSLVPGIVQRTVVPGNSFRVRIYYVLRSNMYPCMCMWVSWDTQLNYTWSIRLFSSRSTAAAVLAIVRWATTVKKLTDRLPKLSHTTVPGIRSTKYKNSG